MHRARLGQPGFQPTKGHPLQHAGHVGHAAAESVQHEGAEDRIAVHRLTEQGARDQHRLDRAGANRLAGIGLVPQEAERGLHAALPRLYRVKQHFAAIGGGQAHLDPARQHHDKALRRLARMKQHGACGQAAAGQGGQALPQRRAGKVLGPVHRLHGTRARAKRKESGSTRQGPNQFSGFRQVPL